MSEEKLLKDLVTAANSMPRGRVDVTAGVMKSIRERLAADDRQNEQELSCFHTFYWAGGISVALVLMLLISLSLYGETWFNYSDFSIFNLLVSS